MLLSGGAHDWCAYQYCDLHLAIVEGKLPSWAHIVLDSGYVCSMQVYAHLHTHTHTHTLSLSLRDTHTHSHTVAHTHTHVHTRTYIYQLIRTRVRRPNICQGVDQLEGSSKKITKAQDTYNYFHSKQRSVCYT